MFEFQKLCNEVEKLSTASRGELLVTTSISVIHRLKELNLGDLHPIEVLVTFIIGSVISDGSISEKDYLYIYPSLAKAFNDVCDISQIKYKYKVSKDTKKEIEEATKYLNEIILQGDESLKSDIVLLCLLITSVDGKISLKEKRYIKMICK